MVNEVFSEFSFGFAITSEWIDRLAQGLVVPPELPSLLREGQTGGGWDVFLQSPTLCTYLQFKLAEHMVKATAGQYSSHNQPYYRFWLRNKVGNSGQTQHEMLIRLDQQPGNWVLYVAPAFTDQQDWANHYFDRSVLTNSICFSPKELGPVDRSENHCVTFDSASVAYGYLHSEPVRVRTHPGKDLNVAPRDMLHEVGPLSLERLRHERANLVEICKARPTDITKSLNLFRTRLDGEIIEWLSIAYEMSVMARSYLDASLLLVAGA